MGEWGAVGLYLSVSCGYGGEEVPGMGMSGVRDELKGSALKVRGC